VRQLDEHPLRDPIAEATIRQKMSMSLFGMARYDEGKRNAERALELVQGTQGAHDELVLAGKLALAFNLTMLMDAPSAERLAREAVEGCERTYGLYHVETLRALQCLWVCCYVFGYADECGQIADRRMEIVRTSPRPIDYLAFQIKAEAALTLFWQHRLDEAKSLAQEAVDEGGSSRNRTMGLAFSHLVLANILAAKGDLAASEQCMRTAVDVLTAASGETGSLEFRALLAMCVSLQPGREDEGLKMLRETIDVARAAIGTDAPRTAHLQSLLMRRLGNLGRFDEAEVQYTEYFAMIRRGHHVPIQTHAEKMHDFGRLFLKSGEPAEAERTFRDGLALAETFTRAQWKRHMWDDRLMLSGLASALQAQKKEVEAEPIYALLRARAAESHDAAQARRLASELRELGRVAEAEAIVLPAEPGR